MRAPKVCIVILIKVSIYCQPNYHGTGPGGIRLSKVHFPKSSPSQTWF